MSSTAEVAEGHLKRALGLPSLVLFGLVYMVPLTVFTTYGIVTQTSGGRVPLSYLVTLAAMVFTARRTPACRWPIRLPGRHTPTRRSRSALRSGSSPVGRCCSTTCSCR